jgi:hypothetical protein
MYWVCYCDDYTKLVTCGANGNVYIYSLPNS